MYHLLLEGATVEAKLGDGETIITHSDLKWFRIRYTIT